MDYINKKNEEEANCIIDEYLKIAKSYNYNEHNLYTQFGSFSKKNDLVSNILLPEQNNRCCYCQKRLPNRTYGTIEHIIRQSIPDADSMKKYFNPNFIGLNSNNVCHTSEYFEGTSKAGQYPHKVAYHNFAMACVRCNNNRANQDIEPLFLFPNIKNEVAYNRNTGEMEWTNDPEVVNPTPISLPTVEKLQLNDSLLKAIRAVWLYGKDNPQETYSTPDTIKDEKDKRKLIYETFGNALSNNPQLTIDDLNAFLSLLTPAFWNNLLQYDYFSKI